MAFSMINIAILTEDWVSNNSDPLYQDTFDKGLLTISFVSTALFFSFTIMLEVSIICGLSKDNDIPNHYIKKLQKRQNKRLRIKVKSTL